jgi:hypothetical protein
VARLDDIKLKANWANEHIKHLNTTLRSFHAVLYEKRNDFIGTEDHPKTGKKRFYVKAVPEVPPEISLIAADVLGTLRSALDHLAYGIVEVANPSVIATKPEQVYFPIAKSSKHYMSPEFRRKVEFLGKVAVKRLDKIEPYKGGNGIGHLLWQLHELNNFAKHRLLLTVAMRFKERTFTSDDFSRMRSRMPNADPGVLSIIRATNFGGPVGPLKVGDDIYVKEPHVQEKISLSFEVAFNEPNIIKCESVFETLYIMFKLVENNIIPRFADLL